MRTHEFVREAESHRLRIGTIAPPRAPVPPSGYGGTEAVLDRLARGLVRLGHAVLLFTTGDSTCPVDRQWVLPHSEPSRVGNAPAEVRHVVHAYDVMRDMDVVHDNTVVGRLYAWRFPELPVATTKHGPFDDGSPPSTVAPTIRVRFLDSCGIRCW